MDSTQDANVRREMLNLQSTTRSGFALNGRPLVVAAVYSPDTLRAAVSLRAAPGAAPDLLELRLDHFAGDPGVLNDLAVHAPRPLLLTARRPDEGGGDPNLDDRTRQQLYARFLPLAVAVDVEVRSLGPLAEIVAAAKREGVRVIASFHDFEGMPDAARLRELVGQAIAAGADVFKLAAMTRSATDLARLLHFLGEEQRVSLAVMGMGPLGRASRPVLAAAGSVLNYGYLGAVAQVPGQWQATLLRERITELESGGGGGM